MVSTIVSELYGVLKLTEHEKEFAQKCLDLVDFINHTEYSLITSDETKNKIGNLRQAIKSAGEDIPISRKAEVLHYVYTGNKLSILLAHLLD